MRRVSTRPIQSPTPEFIRAKRVIALLDRGEPMSERLREEAEMAIAELNQMGPDNVDEAAATLKELKESIIRWALRWRQ